MVSLLTIVIIRSTLSANKLLASVHLTTPSGTVNDTLFILVSYLLSVMICIFESCDVKAIFAHSIVIECLFLLLFILVAHQMVLWILGLFFSDFYILTWANCLPK